MPNKTKLPPLSDSGLRFLPFVSGLCCLLLWFGLPLQAQYQQRLRRLPWPADSLLVPDSLSLVESSLECVGDSSVVFSYNLKTNRLRLLRFRQKKDSILLKFSVFPFAAWKPVFRYNPLQYDSMLAFADYPGRRLRLAEKREELFPLPGIQKSGVISRGISLGNGQNGFVNSSMNLQLEGMIAKDVRLTALLSDQSLPFQPQGNTQQIRDLDRILIRLEHKRAALSAGDVQITGPESSAFFKLFRNVQGGEIIFSADSSGHSRSRIAAGIAKGKFASVILPVKEGVMGPYRLRPPDNPELTFVILAGSERLWFDGRLLRRGFNEDYVIDYNSGEVTLNNHLLPTRFTRLRCDFEYADRNYSRSAFLLEHQEIKGPVRISLGHYQEQDNPYRPLGFSLDSSSLAVLREAGDKSGAALLSGVEKVAPASQLAGSLYYEKADTLLEGKMLSYYRLYQPDGIKDLYRVGFTETLPGGGDYQLSGLLGNGKFYVYTGPGKGNFTPGRPTVLPDKKSLSRISAEADAGKAGRFRAEAAFSRQDLNRYSSLEDADNDGSAQQIAWEWQRPKEQMDSVSSAASVSITRLSRNFRGIDRFRDIEFERNWSGRTGDTLKAEDVLLETGFRKSRQGRWSVAAHSNWRKKGDNVRGFQQQLSWEHKAGPLLFQNDGFWMQNQRADGASGWKRLGSGIALPGKQWTPFWQFRLDENEIRDASGRVKASAMHYRSQSIGIRSADSVGGHFSALYTYREDRLLRDGVMVPGLFSQNVSLNAGLSPGAGHEFGLTGNFRLAKMAGSSPAEENLGARMDYRGSLAEGCLRQELVVTANTGQEAKRSFQFIRLNAPGEGNYQWLDYNGNGLQELDEFVEAKRPEDRLYIRIFIPTRDFISAYTRSLNYRLNLSAPRSWQSRGALLKFLSRLVWLSSLTEDRKSTSGNLAERFLPLSGNDGDAVLSSTLNHRHTLFFNRNRPDFGGELSFVRARSKILLSNGFSRRESGELRLMLRKNLSSYLNLNLQFLAFERKVGSDALGNQNFTITGKEAGPELAWQAGLAHRISMQLQYGQRQSNGSENRAGIWQNILEYRGAEAGTRSINASLRYSRIQFAGTLLSPASYELLEGLLPGENLTWTINLQQKLSQGLQLLLSYDGRKSGSFRAVHLGKVQANLLF